MVFCAILMGNDIMVYTDHNNLTHKSTENGFVQILRQTIIIKEHNM